MAPLELRVRMVPRKDKRYPYFYIPLPSKIARTFLEALGIELERADGLPLTVLFTKAPWYHGVDMTGLTEGLSEKALREVEALHLNAPPGERPELVAILASREEVEELGLRPDEPLTLKDVVEAVARRLVSGNTPLLPKLK